MVGLVTRMANLHARRRPALGGSYVTARAIESSRVPSEWLVVLGQTAWPPPHTWHNPCMFHGIGKNSENVWLLSGGHAGYVMEMS